MNARAPSSPQPRVAGFAVAVLTAINLLNYVDRYVPSAVKELFKRDLGLTDAQTSLPLTAFVVVYMLTSPVFGTLGDRVSRPRLIAAGVALWSLATAAAAWATGFWSLLATRAWVGVGEAAYATLAPALLSDFYPPERRNRILTLFYVAIPVGSAIGFALGGLAGQRLGWRAAFLIAGVPGLIAAAFALMIREPGRGLFDKTRLSDSKANRQSSDAMVIQDAQHSEASLSWSSALQHLRRNRPYVIAVVGYTLVTFASGGMADWFPTFLARVRGMNLAEVGGLVGTMTVFGGLGGTLVGGVLGDQLRGRTRQPYLALSGGSMVLATGFSVMALRASHRTQIAIFIFLAQFFMWFYNGPLNTLIVNSVASSLRARAVSLSILCIHLFGDAISPPIIGYVSDATGSLQIGVTLIPITLALGAAVWLIGWRWLPESADALGRCTNP